MAVTHTSRLFMLQDTGSRLLHIITWSLHSILSMALSSHVLSKHLSALDAGCSSVAHSLPFSEGCPTCGNVTRGPGIGESSLNITEHTLVVLFSLHHCHGTWQLFPHRPLLDSACQGPPMVFPVSPCLVCGYEGPHTPQACHWNHGLVAPHVPVGR